MTGGAGWKGLPPPRPAGQRQKMRRREPSWRRSPLSPAAEDQAIAAVRHPCPPTRSCVGRSGKEGAQGTRPRKLLMQSKHIGFH